MDPADDAVAISVSVAYSPRAGVVDEIALSLRLGATADDALRESGLRQLYPGLDLDSTPIGIWGVRCERSALLRDRDRVEIYRPLQVDPKEARRMRHRAQGKARGRR